MLGIILVLLSFCTYPILLYVAKEQQSVWHGEFATDIFMYYRAMLVCIGGILLTPTIKNVYRPFFFYAALLIISTALSPYKYTTLFGTPNYYEGAFVILAYLVIAMQKKFPQAAVSVAVYIVGLAGLIQYFYGCYLGLPIVRCFMPKNISFAFVPRPLFATLGNPNHLGLFCALLVPFFLARRKKKLSIVLIALLIFSCNRGAWLSVFITTLYQFKHYWKRVVLISALCLIPVFPKVIEAVKGIHFPLRSCDLSGRCFIWAETLPMLKHHWLVGSGPGAFAIDFANNTKGNPSSVFSGVIVDRPHNMYLNIWYSTGFLSLLIWLYITIDFFINCGDKAMRLGVLGFLIADLFTDSVVSVTPFFMAMLGAGL